MVKLSKAMNLHVKLWGIIMIICKTGVIAVTNIREEMTKMILSLLSLSLSRDPEITHLGALAGTEGQASH